MQSAVCKNVGLNRLDGDMTSPENFGQAYSLRKMSESGKHGI